MPNKKKKNKKNSPAVFEDGHLVRRNLSDDDASSLNGAVPTPAPIPKKSKKRKPAASPPQSSGDDVLVDQASSSEYEDSEAPHHSYSSGEGDRSVASRSSRSLSPAASVLHESAGCTPEQLHEDHRRSFQLKLNSYLNEMFNIAQQRSQLPQTLSNFQKLDELAQRHRQLTILADELRSILSFMKGGSTSFNSDRNVSPCHPRPQGQWQPREHGGTNWSSSSSSRSRSPSSASSHSVLSWASEPDTITSSPQTNVFSSSLTKERTITSSAQERTSTPPSGKREENDQWITVPSRKSKRKETPSTRSSGKRKEKFSTRSSDKRKEKRSTLPSNQRKEKSSTPPSNQRKEKSSTSPSNQRREKKRVLPVSCSAETEGEGKCHRCRR